MDDLSADTRQLISDRINASGQMTGDYAQDDKNGLFKEFQPTKYDFGLNAQNDAIAAKAKARFYDPAIANLQTQQKAEYAGKVQQQMQNTQALGLAQLRYDNARMLAARQRVADEEAQRAQMIATVFQIAGIAGGAYLGAGTKLGAMGGAVVGGQLGAAGGNMAAGGHGRQK